MLRSSFVGWVALVLLLWPASWALAVDAEQTPTLVGGYSVSEALRLGEQMYRFGILSDGEPMQAVVQWDIPVDGTMFSCESCHLRSGLGTVEGTVITLPTNGRELYQPFTKAPEETLPPWEQMQESMAVELRRPAYTDETLAKALWVGTDPSGREFSWTMPRYDLEDKDMEVLVHYLRNLSAEPDPGVSDESIVFATVVSDQVPELQRRALLETLQKYVDDRNLQNRRQEERARKGPFYRKHMLTAYRRLELRVWTLDGPPAGWCEQLKAYYDREPVFAMLGGLVSGSWEPIHKFCETQRLPSLFPITDRPVLSPKDWYTVYFSEGWAQEGETLARYLAGFRGEEKGGGQIVLATRQTAESQAISNGFRAIWEKIGDSTIAEISLPEGPVGADFWADLAKTHPSARVIVPLDDAELSALASLPELPGRPEQLLISGRLLSDQFSRLPENVRGMTLLTYPLRLPEDRESMMRLVTIWLRGRQLEVTDIDIQAKVYFIGTLLTGALMHLQSDFYRDYLLDTIDMMEDQYYTIINYPRLSFGQGQRYASKGCYLVRVTPGPDAQLDPQTPWVIH